MLVKDIIPQDTSEALNSLPQFLTNAGGVLFFFADDGVHDFIYGKATEVKPAPYW